MSLSAKASLFQVLRNKLYDIVFHDRLILWARFGLVFFYYLMLFHGGQPAAAYKTAFHLYLPLLLLIYVLITLFGLSVFSFRAVNYSLSVIDIALISAGIYFSPERIFWGAFILYFVGMSLELIYGRVSLTLVLVGLANLGYLIALQSRIVSQTISSYVYWIVNFNFIVLFTLGFGARIKRSVLREKKEKDESKKQYLRLQALSRIAREIAGELENDKLWILIVQKAAELTKAPAGGLILKDNEAYPRETFRIKAIKGLSKSYLETEVHPGADPLGRGLTAKQSRVEHCAATPLPDDPDLAQYRFVLTAPIWSKNDIIGALFLLSDSHIDPFSREDRFLLEALSEHAAIAVTNASLYKATSSLSLNDYLTGVGNLRFFHQQLDHCVAISERYKQTCSLMLVDLDCFKQIIDQFGNARGFLYLKQFAQILKNFIRSSDVIARYDRDLFMLLLPQTDLDEAVRLGDRIRESVAQTPLMINGTSIQTTVCIGIANYPADASNCKSLIAAVETALYRAKHLGANKLVTGQTGNYYYQM